MFLRDSIMTMVSLRLFSFLCVLVILICQSTAQPSFVKYFCIDENGNYTANSTYQTNLNTLLSNLYSDTDNDYGFYNSSYGQNSDKISAIAMCRGDVKPNDCRTCLNNSRVLLTQNCPNEKEAIGWYDTCMLRYSNRSIFGTMETNPPYLIWNLGNATSPDQYNKVVRDLLERLRSEAASGDSRRKFAANETASSFQTIYAFLQCTPDLSKQECNDCLVGSISDIGFRCAGRIRCRIFKPSCNLRFDTRPFYDLTAADGALSLPPPQASHPPSYTNTTSIEGKSKSSRTVIAILVPIAAFVVVLHVFICIFLRLRKARKFVESETYDDEEIQPTGTMQFDFDTLKLSTNNFSDANKLGQGGFGPVYKGTLFNGQEVAVKRLSRNNGQGDIEFKNEMLLVAKLQHRNLVRILGFCLERRERLIVYELLSNKSLDYFIFDPIKRFLLNWERRLKIIKGIARGLLYLHEDSRLRIIHRDLKASNILLDKELNPKISDFGMARLFFVDQSQGNTNRIVGTLGYMAPEYAAHGQFSIKSDVFSFGVLVLEIISGHKNSEIRDGEYVEHIVSFAWRNWREGTTTDIIDSTLDVGSRNEMMRCIHVALLCVQENVANRPTMASVMLMLDSNSVTLPRPLQPAFFVHGTNLSETQSLEHNAGETRLSNDVGTSRNDASITEQYPR